MKGPKTRLMLNEPNYFRIRNDHGEVLACAFPRLTGSASFAVYIGFSFCNPVDFNLDRDLRILHGHKAAEGRAKVCALLIPRNRDPNKGAFYIEFDEAFEDIDQKELVDKVRNEIYKTLVCQSGMVWPFGFKYYGDGDGKFKEWLTKFCMAWPKELLKKYTVM